MIRESAVGARGGASAPPSAPASTIPGLIRYGVPDLAITDGDAVPVPFYGERISRTDCSAAFRSAAFKYVEVGRDIEDRSGAHPREWLMTPDLYRAFSDRARTLLKGGLSSQGLNGAFSADQLSKWMPENGGAFGWYVPPLLNYEARTEPRFDTRITAWIRRKMYTGWPDFPSFMQTTPLRVPTDSSHGAPTFASGIPDLLAHLGLASEMLEAHTPARAHRLAKEANSLANARFLGDRAAVMTHSRTGPNKKPTPTRFFSGGRLTEAGSTTGLFCRRRHVRGVSTWFNEVIRGPIMWSQLGLKRWGGFSHGSDESMQRKFRDTYRRASHFGPVQLISDDSSNYDDTVSLVHLEQMRDEVYLWPDDFYRWAYTETLSIPVLSGPLYERDTASLTPRHGGVASGLISTTLDDTVVNICIIVTCISHASKRSVQKVLDALDSGELAIWVQGDDTLIFTSWEIDRAAYKSLALEFGYIRKIEDYPIFLMRWYDPRSLSGSYGSSIRAAMRTATRESRALGPHFERFATYIRWSGVIDDPLREEAVWLSSDLPYDKDDLMNPLAALSSPELVEGMQQEMGGPQGTQKTVALVRNLLARGVTTSQMSVLRRLGLLEIYENEARYTNDGRGYDWRTHFRAVGDAGDDFSAAGRD